MEDIATMTDSTSEVATSEVAAAPSDNYNDGSYTTGDSFLLVLGISLVCFGIAFKSFFRKMYINVLGGRKGE